MSSQGAALFLSLLLGDAAGIERLLVDGAEPDVTDDGQRTPLHFAAKAGHQEIVALLLRHGAAIDARDENDTTPLHFAAGAGHGSTVAMLLAHGAGIAATDRGGHTALHFAASAGNVEVVRHLLKHGADLAAANKSGWTPLHYAVAERHLAVADLLLQRGAPQTRPDAPLYEADIVSMLQWIGVNSPVRSSPLLLAVQSGDREMTQLLLDRGADPEQAGFNTGERRCTPFMHGKVERLQCEHNPARFRQTGFVLNLAVEQGDADLLRLLLQHGATPAGNTLFPPLAAAVARGDPEMVQLLLEHGADARAAMYDGLTPLHLAAAHGQTEVARLLLARGASVDAASRAPRIDPSLLHSYAVAPTQIPVALGVTPLHLALLNGRLEMVELLLQQGADIGRRTQGPALARFTPLDLAIDNGNLRFPESHSPAGSAPLAEVTPKFAKPPTISPQVRLAMVRLLLAHGAIANERRLGGYSPLQIAAQVGDAAVAELLRRHGAQ